MQCSFAKSVWNWLSSSLQLNLDLLYLLSILSVLKGNWSSQVHDVIMAAITNVFGAISFSKKQCMFMNASIC